MPEPLSCVLSSRATVGRRGGPKGLTATCTGVLSGRAWEGGEIPGSSASTPSLRNSDRGCWRELGGSSHSQLARGPRTPAKDPAGVGLEAGIPSEASHQRFPDSGVELPHQGRSPRGWGPSSLSRAREGLGVAWAKEGGGVAAETRTLLPQVGCVGAG